MSFNYLEIAHAAEIIRSDLPVEVLGVELVEFAGSQGELADLNIALRFKGKRLLVFSLKSPWTGVFYHAPGAWKASKSSWVGAFGKTAQDWNAYLRGQLLEKITSVDGDRILRLAFANGAEVEIQLFPARPNWILNVGGEQFHWREPAARRPLATTKPKDALALREFEGLAGDWMARAYQHYLALRQSALISVLVQKGLSHLQARMTQLIKIRGQMDTQLRESLKADALLRQAELLKANLHLYPQGHRAARVELEGTVIDLDRKTTLSDNASRFFTRYKKLQRTRREIEARLIGIEAESKSITASIAKLRGFKPLESEQSKDTVGRLVDFLGSLGIAPVGAKEAPKLDKKWRAATEKHGLRKFASKDGAAIWVGRNHVENEELVIRLARGNDLWMHLKGRPGAHVIVQLPQGKSASLETLLDGATLVAYYSGVAEKEKVEVDYTFRKYVKRVPGNGDKFLVTYSQNKTLMVKVEEERLWRLLKQH